MDRGAWQATVRGVTEPGRLQSMQPQKVGHEQLARKRGQRRSVGLRKRREGHGLHTGEETLSEKRTTDPENMFGSACVCVCVFSVSFLQPELNSKK